MEQMELEERLDVEWLIVADGAQVSNGKLYVLGGGWDVLTLPAPLPVQHKLAIACAIKVPWTETNSGHQFRIRIEHEDGQLLGEVGGAFEVGRAPGLVRGQPQRAQLAFDVGLPLEKQGMYSVVASVDGEDIKRTWFRVVQAGVPALPA